MPWWDHPWDSVRARFAGSAGPVPADAGPTAAAAESPREEWRDVPRLQRTLAEPIAPVAINDRFRDSLATFADPSFLAPLSHQVDPSSGGLVAGLVSPGHPQARGGPELVVPQRAAASPLPAVQRLALWSTATTEPELTTVPLEYPHRPPVTSGGEPFAEPAPPATTSPLVATPDPGVDVSAGPIATPDLPATGSAAPTAAPTAPVPAAPAPTALPQVQRTPVAQRRAAELPPSPTPLAGSPAVEPAGDPPPTIQTSAASPTGARPAPSPDKGVEAEASVTELEVVTPEPSTADPAAVLELPVAGPGDSAVSPPSRPVVPAAQLSVQQSADGSDTPTLGVGWASAPLPVPAPPLSPSLRPPDDPPVQRLTFLSGPPGAQPGALSSSSPRLRPTEVVAEPAPGAARADPGAGRADLPTVQPLRELPPVPARDSSAATAQRSHTPVVPPSGGVGSPNPPGPDAVVALPPPPIEAEGHQTWPDVVVSRLTETGHPGADVAGFTEVPLVVAGSPARPSAARPDESTIGHPIVHAQREPSWASDTPPDPPAAADAPSPAAGEPPLGPAVPVEPWTSTAITPPTPPSAGTVSQVKAPITAVQRRTVGAPASTPPVALTAPRHEGAEIAPPAPSYQPPLVVSRRVAATEGPERGPRPGEGISFERMFAAAVPSATGTAAPAEPDQVSLQRQPLDSGASPSEPSVSAMSEPAAAPVPGGPGPAGGEGAGGTAANLDEMARRLYEPLAARLREELWLDRERAGLMSDV